MAKKKEKRTKAVKKIPIKKTAKSKVDKWKLKKNYVVIAPKLFEEKEISDIVATDEKNLYNRVIRYPYSSLVNKFDELSQYTTVKLRITEVKGKSAHTTFIGSQIASSYIGSLARRKRSIINEFMDVTTKDNSVVRVKITIITRNRISSSAKTAMRKVIGDFIRSKSSETTLNEFIMYILSNKVENDVRKDLQKIAPIKKVLIHKIEIKNTVV